ncbi:carbohydrate ABC transporter permease [Microbacterium sp. A94]|uniref:carbohydrate ABC transporter permease n=1 Tax=Microbacterium sp. A94 TaxID=3450717 RepID=UPI003F42A07E
MTATMTEELPATRRSSPPAARRGVKTGWRVTPYLFLLPFFVLFAVFVLLPIGAGLAGSLYTWVLGLPNQPFVGFKNYAELFAGETSLAQNFWQGMKVTGVFTAFSVPLLIVIPVCVALMLHQRFRGRTFFRAVFFAPYVLSVAVIGLLWRYLLDRQLGPVNALLEMVGLPSDISWTTSMPEAYVSLITVTVWWTLGFNAVIYLAALQDVPAELHEAAKMDGAGAWRRFWTVTVPGTKRVLQFMLTMTIIASANMYGQSAIITLEGPGTATRTVIGVIATTGMQNYNIGAASAMSMIVAVLLMAASGLVLFMFRRVGGSDE